MELWFFLVSGAIYYIKWDYMQPQWQVAMFKKSDPGVLCVHANSGRRDFRKEYEFVLLFSVKSVSFRKELRPHKSPDLNQYYYLWGRLNE